MIIFIQLTNAKEGMKQMFNLSLIESFTELKNGSIVHFKGSMVTVKESLKEIESKINNIK